MKKINTLLGMKIYTSETIKEGEALVISELKSENKIEAIKIK